jgi:sterol desaturase/sphingolipid hydroxylase (fatty acid hydroxylase superfamily)
MLTARLLPRRGLVAGGRPLCWATVAGAGLAAWSVWQRLDIAFALVVLGLPLSLLERWRPLHHQRPAFRRTGAATDAASFVVNEVLAGAGLAAVLLVAVPVGRLVVPDALTRTLEAQPEWTRWLEAFVISEVCGYWGHRLSHEVPVLWRFHRVHHSAPELDWLAPSRRHPVDAVVARTSTALPVLMLGFAVPTVATWFALKRIQGLLVHANVDVRLGVLERAVATPFFHHRHHSAAPGTWNTNYAGSIPAVDWLFGTLHLPDGWPAEYGCDGFVPDVGYVDRIMSPWSRRPSRANSTFLQDDDDRPGGTGQCRRADGARFSDSPRCERLRRCKERDLESSGGQETSAICLGLSKRGRDERGGSKDVGRSDSGERPRHPVGPGSSLAET